MKASDYIVQFFIEHDIKDVFGYPGGMVTHFMDSLGKREGEICTHIAYHEQAAAFEACGYAQYSGKVGVAFATSGPGATNLVTGIANAYYDSIPTIFITGQVNTFESKRGMEIRQKGFQETDIVSMVKDITKGAYYISAPCELPNLLEYAFWLADSGRKGPVLLDIPMNIFRSEIELGSNAKMNVGHQMRKSQEDLLYLGLKEALSISKRPCLLIGNGVKIERAIDELRKLLMHCPLPVVSSMLAVDVVTEENSLEGLFYGFVGAYGNRTANFTVAKCDLLISIGSRLDVRQVGANRENFAPNAQIVRIDIDEQELQYKVHENEKQFCIDLKIAISILTKILCELGKTYNEWVDVCREIKRNVKYVDEKNENRVINAISKKIPDEVGVVADVGQNMVWVAQSFRFKNNQQLHLSGGMGAMGYALPAAIGVHYASHKPVICFCGDGGLQMNIQELQYISTNKLPITIFVLNNSALGMIRHFQEMYFESKYFYTISEKGYSVPDFCKVGRAYGIESKKIYSLEEVKKLVFNLNKPVLYEIVLEQNTIISPKLEYGKPNQDQEPLLERTIYQYLMNL